MEKTYENGYYDVSEEALENEKNVNSGSNENYGNKVVFDTKNYLNVKLADNETSKTLKIRLLPFPETKSPFLHIHMHSLKNVPAEIAKSGFKSYVCLSKTEGLDTEKFGNKCPFCEKASEAFNKMRNEKDPQKKAQYKEEGKDNLPMEVVIMRCIERGKEDEGVKFWKVNVHKAKDDPYNLIYTLWETRKAEWLEDPDNEGRDKRESNILSINDYGYDLTITIKKESKTDASGKAVEKTSYQVTDAKKPSPLSSDPEQVKAWVCDEKKWYEVFVPKSYDYLKIVMDGELPWYDREAKKWVPKKDNDKKKEEEKKKIDEEIKKAEAAASSALTETQKEVVQEAPVKTAEKTPEDDLPF